MKIVCGQTHPQNKRPNAAVNKMMKTTNVIMVRPKMKKSCGQKYLSENDKSGLRYVKKNKGLPLTVMKGSEKNKMQRKTSLHKCGHYTTSLWAFEQRPISFDPLHLQ